MEPTLIPNLRKKGGEGACHILYAQTKQGADFKPLHVEYGIMDDFMDATVFLPGQVELMVDYLEQWAIKQPTWIFKAWRFFPNDPLQ